MPRIEFGNIVRQNDKQVITGLSNSGLDTETLIKAELQNRQIILDRSQEDINQNTKKLIAYNDFRKKLVNIKELTSMMRGYKTYTNTDIDVFATKFVNIQTADGLPANNYLTATANDNALSATYELLINNLATSYSQIFKGFTSNGDITSNNLVPPGAITLNNVDITVELGDTLDDLKNKINAVKAETEVGAEVIKVAANDYRLLLKSLKTGIINSFSLIDTNSILTNLTVTTTNAIDANITFNQINIERPENVISDVIDGLTLNLVQKSASKFFITIENNTQAVKGSILQLQTEYNNLCEFYAQQTSFKNDKPEEGLAAEAVLGREGLLQEVMHILRGFFVNIIPTSSRYNSLGALGISFIRTHDTTTGIKLDNFMNIDVDKLEIALEHDFNAVTNLFAANFKSTSSRFTLLQSSNFVQLNAFKIDVDFSRPDDDKARILYTDPYTNAAATTQALYQVSDNLVIITGKPGTLIEGLKIAFLHNNFINGVTDIHLTQGAADKIYNYLDSILVEPKGRLVLAQEAVLNSTQSHNEKISRMQDEIRVEHDKLLVKYARIENAIIKANSMISVLETFDGMNNTKQKK